MCVVLKKSTNPIVSDCEPYTGSSANLRNPGRSRYMKGAEEEDRTEATTIVIAVSVGIL